MNISLRCDAYGVADLPTDLAATIEGGAGGWARLLEPLAIYLVNNTEALIEGVKEGWNGYQP